ncbi:ER membrane protein complex subunit 7-like [Holothuria leucospilota]|uniref:ER membrane protein complex subunit 7-like n=1 Tax=Holothuria leucospilota TaxID=206669 RepID=A0A9Q1BJF4_HOLLE|nr:ER membrane protein complex subunit 7-like [Holothuria leucospilota]
MKTVYVRTILCILTRLFLLAYGEDTVDSAKKNPNELFTIEGKASVPGMKASEWIPATKILIDGGNYQGFLKSDGSFQLFVPTGSYVIDLTHPTLDFEPQRVDVNSKGNKRARKLNNIQPNAVSHLTYPLRFKPKGQMNYFQKREEFRIIDILKSPMEMQSLNLMNPKQDMPDLSEMVTNLFGGGAPPQKKKEKAVKGKKK